MKSGFYEESFTDYIKADGANRSFLHDMISWSPGHAKWRSENQEDTKSLRLGHAFHPAVLEPDRFKEEFVLLPANCMKGTKENPNKGMAANLAAFEAKCEANNQVIITQKEYDNIKEMVAIVQADQEALDLLSDGVAEISGYFIDPDYDILVKIRPDWINKKHRIIPDLKSCADAREFPFRASAYDHGYDMQAFMILYGITQITGIPHDDFEFICVESKGYHGLHIWQADLEMLDTGFKKYKKAMRLYKQCMESGEWPGYDSTPQLLGSPSYAKEQKEIEPIYDGDPIK